MASRTQLTERDLELLGFLALHRVVLADQIAVRLGISASAAAARLRALAADGYLERRRVFHRRPACHLITRTGLRVLGSRLPVPRLDLSCYAHDIGLAWVWLAARGGAFGELSEILAERELRSRDALRAGEAPGGHLFQPPLGVRGIGSGPGGRERLHYPDLLLRTASGHRVAVELELTAKGAARRRRILSVYGTDVRVDAVLYLVPDPRVGRMVAESARRVGLSDLIHVQLVRYEPPTPPTGRAFAATSRRAGSRAPGAGR
ncbi:MAG: hypothetical protein ACYC91_12035 [Solirubrobacteraceae bacterium]